MRGTKITGISSEVRHSVSVIAVLLAIPVVIGLLMMILYSSRYQAMIQRMDAAAELKPALETTIAENLFSVAAGRTDYKSSGVTKTIAEINGTLDQLTAETAGNGHLQLTIARRTMDTMEQYVLEVRDGMENHQPITEIEGIVDEVRNVGRLVANMLDTFITEEIADATATSKRLHVWMWASGVTEVLLLIAAIYRLTTGHINITTCKSGSQAAERHGKWSARFSSCAVEVPFRIAVLIQTAVLQLHALRHSHKVCAANKKCTFRHSNRCAIGHRFGMIRGFGRNVSAPERSTTPIILVAVHKAAIHAGSRIRHRNGGRKHNLIGRTQRNVYRRKERDAKDAFHIRIRRLVSNHVCCKTEQRYT